MGCSPWGHKQLDMTWRLNNNELSDRPSLTQQVSKEGSFF